MSLGAGVIEGNVTDKIIGFRPGDLGYEAHTGAVFHPQDESNNQNIAYYEIQNTGDEIDINLGNYIFGMEEPVLVLHTIWGETDYSIIERDTGNTTVAEQSGFDNDAWIIDVQATNGKLRITDFDTGSGVDGTQAAWQPVMTVFDLAQ